MTLAQTPSLVGLLVCGMLVGLAGCSREPGVPRGTAEGKITVNGSPVTEGTVIFENAAAGVSVMVPLRSDGTYTVSTYQGAGVPVGTYKVAVSPRKIAEGGGFPKVIEPGKQVQVQFPAPEKFRSVETSGWTAVVKEGKNEAFNFDAK